MRALDVAPIPGPALALGQGSSTMLDVAPAVAPALVLALVQENSTMLGVAPVVVVLAPAQENSTMLDVAPVVAPALVLVPGQLNSQMLDAVEALDGEHLRAQTGNLLYALVGIRHSPLRESLAGQESLGAQEWY